MALNQSPVQTVGKGEFTESRQDLGIDLEGRDIG